MKLFLLALIIGCAGLEVKERIVKNEIIDVFVREDGKCNYTMEPKHNHRVTVKGECGKAVGDSLERIERYYAEDTK